MNKTVKRLAAAGVVSLGLVGATMVPANADFRAYDYTGYSYIILNGGGDPGYFDVADDRTDSAVNTNGRIYYGRSYTGIGDGNNRVYGFQARTSTSTLGSANNKIDFFYFD